MFADYRPEWDQAGTQSAAPWYPCCPREACCTLGGMITGMIVTLLLVTLLLRQKGGH